MYNKNMVEKKEEIKKEVEISSPKELKKMVPMEDVQKMIDEAIAKSNVREPVKLKKSTEHHAHLWRLDGKWVVNFIDQNWDYSQNKKKDEYNNKKVFAYDKFNEQTRQMVAWIGIIFDDGSTKELPLTSYVQNRIPVYCPIVDRKKKDISYVSGTTEKKNWDDKRAFVGTGIEVEQNVELYEETLTLKTPEGIEVTVPDYVIT